jgi:nucleotide-binding universal stress UspA family protein
MNSHWDVYAGLACSKERDDQVHPDSSAWCAMLSIKKILLPVDYPHASLGVLHQAAALAHHFHSEIVMLHVVPPLSHTVDLHDDFPRLTASEMLTRAVQQAQKNLDQSLGPEFEGLIIERVLAKGDPARAVARTAAEKKADLIMMPSFGYTFNQFLLGSVVLHGTECPVWTGAHVEEPAAQEFAIRSVLCAVDFRPHSHKTVTWAVNLAAEFGARLTLAHVTPSVEIWGPGGTHVNPRWRKELVGSATEHLAELQKTMGTDVEVSIGSGDVPKVLSEAVSQTKADLLVTGSRPYGGHLQTHGFAVICAVPIPVLSV